jgi:hypothetical protein
MTPNIGVVSSARNERNASESLNFSIGVCPEAYISVA